MDAELIEVMDSAVKIGLGAVISYLGTGWLARRSYKEKRLDRRSEERAKLILRASECMEESEAELNNAILSLSIRDFDSSAMNKSIHLIYNARGCTNLLGSKELTDKLNELVGVLEELHSLMMKITYKIIEWRSLSEEVAYFERIKGDVYPLLSCLYDGEFKV